MTRAQRRVNLMAVGLPFLAVIIAVPLLWNSWVSALDLALFGVFYLLTGFGITVGFHRLLTHRALATSKPVEVVFAVLGSMAIEGPVADWVADHRKHHAHADEEGDPHSPHVGHGDGPLGALRGLWYAHAGWLLHTQGTSQRRRYARDIVEDPVMRKVHRLFPLWALLSIALPALLGGLIGGSLKSAATGALWGGFVRIFFIHHVTWSINSVCHFWGRRRFAVEDESRNVPWLALPSLGEAWHHNHHAFPRSAYHGLKPWEISMDPSALLIKLLRRLGLVWNVVEITPERQAAKEAAPRATAGQATTSV
jgi:stearoyl-CoA desaturase (delta-9 desaturase)